MRLLLLALSISFFALSLCAGTVPAEIQAAIRELWEDDGISAADYTEETGVFVVGIGRCLIEETKNKTRDEAHKMAKMRLQEMFAAFLGTRISSAKKYRYEENTNGVTTKINEFFSLLTETQVEQLLKGVQLVEQRVSSEGVVEVAGYMTSRMIDASRELEEAQDAWGERGVVRATGVDSDRKKAEQEALRSAVEQVVGTMVVGKTTLNEKNDLNARLATSATALVDEYRVLEEAYREGQYFVVVAARVSKRKLYDSYRSYFKALNDPTFYLHTSDHELANAFKRYFVDKGVTITENAEDADYMIRLMGRFVERKNPILETMGTTLTISLEVCSADGRKILFQLPSKRFSKDSEVLTQAQRRDEVANRAFRDLKVELDEAFHQMVIRMLDDVE